MNSLRNNDNSSLCCCLGSPGLSAGCGENKAGDRDEEITGTGGAAQTFSTG